MLSFEFISVLCVCCALNSALALAITVQSSQSKPPVTARPLPTANLTTARPPTVTERHGEQQQRSVHGPRGDTLKQAAALLHETHTLASTRSPEARQRRKFKLPSWFNYNLYKQLYGKHYANRVENETHKRIYLKTAVHVFEQRALYRAGRVDSLASMNELSDLTYEELEALRDRSRVKSTAEWNTTDLPDCCNYDQVYEQIIGLLNVTTGPVSLDLPFSKALLDELEQKPLVEYEQKAGDESDSSNIAIEVQQPTAGKAQDGEKANPRRPSSAKTEVPRELEEAIRRQVVEQLSPPVLSRLNARLSAYFGEPVAIRAPTQRPLQTKPTNNATSSV